MYVRIRDAAGNEATATHPYEYAVQSEPWRTWEIPVSELAGVDLAVVEALTIGIGDGADSGQSGDERDVLYIDNIRLRSRSVRSR